MESSGVSYRHGQRGPSQKCPNPPWLPHCWPGDPPMPGSTLIYERFPVAAPRAIGRGACRMPTQQWGGGAGTPHLLLKILLEPTHTRLRICFRQAGPRAVGEAQGLPRGAGTSLSRDRPPGQVGKEPTAVPSHLSLPSRSPRKFGEGHPGPAESVSARWSPHLTLSLEPRGDSGAQ